VGVAVDAKRSELSDCEYVLTCLKNQIAFDDWDTRLIMHTEPEPELLGQSAGELAVKPGYSRRLLLRVDAKMCRE
jgi:hypothetical protein